MASRAVDPHHFLRIRIRIQLNKICNKIPYEEYSDVKKDNKDCSKVKKKHSWIRIRVQEGKLMWIRIHSPGGQWNIPCIMIAQDKERQFIEILETEFSLDSDHLNLDRS